ncbi:MAG TPA: TIGR02281 family clan AA aspartic protease [Paracoccus solventivorans]|uniref:retropepsin-like aspartic protease family protein n=1 Tax=Paracoccus solventivorans TaxID=53463 RepID=UPI002C2A3AB2|nr:TIGR02281 family clan AA aspartic protease [Paracoccus solventivorans]HMM09243.1 TIGR02281 family clan AA aspartic protease [Paracoccus solventivorans]
MSIDPARLAYLTLLLLALGAFVVVEFRRDAGSTLRAVLAWGLIFLAAIGAAGLWQDISRDVMPRQAMLDPTRIEVPLGPDGHFHLTAELNGAPVRFIVDTGASALALSPRDARRAGIDLERLVYAGQARTANGIVPTATVRLERVAIGDILDENVPAMVIQADIDRSLMGMDYLRRFARVSFEGDSMILER